MQKRDFETYQKCSEILRSGQNFPRPTFFEVPFATPFYAYWLMASTHVKSLSLTVLLLAFIMSKAKVWEDNNP